MLGIMRHISYARDWLCRAEKKIESGDLVEGEFFLSLAEAETRKAWERSYSSRNRWSSRKFPLALTFSLLLAAAIAFVFFFRGDPQLEPVELKLTEGYQQSVRLTDRGNIRLISVDLSVNNNLNRGK
ncbi:hypothetical protein [Halocella sp. SP3-1]|uniref:hypothetical protein n=1 Tax=Halocella sp. SP3-1 TaxID=2382161 RepID=UPI000F7E2F55|nr:hypothetical protein [Halocella sp. SP3-1]